MQIFFYILVSIISGIFAGMGMGGGTFLIPMLSLFFKINQVVCQSTNVFCFIVLAIFCFVIYTKNKLINFKTLIFVAIPAGIISFASSFFALKINSQILHIGFAIFILIIGIISLVSSIKQIKLEKKKEEKN